MVHRVLDVEMLVSICTECLPFACEIPRLREKRYKERFQDSRILSSSAATARFSPIRYDERGLRAG